MNLELIEWTEKDYLELEEYLLSYQNLSYALFTQKITPTKYPIIGINLPLQSKISDKISKGYSTKFIDNLKIKYLEELNIKGFVLTKLEEKELDKRLDKYVYQIDNWSTCDSFCARLKIVKQNQEKYLLKIKKYLESEEEFVIRVGLVLLLNYYVEEKYIKEILLEVSKIKSDKYYVNMAMAWLVAECYIKEKNLVLPFIQNNSLNTFTRKKIISKLCDSYRISDYEKVMLKNLYRDK